MKNCAIGVLVAIILAASGLVAADFWEKKKFTEWSDRDIQKLMTDSPWSQSLSAYLKGFGGSPGGMGGGGRSGGGGRGGGGRGGGGMGAEQGSGGGIDAGMGGGGDSGPAPSGLPVIMRWITSLPLREAGVRLKYKDEAGSSKEAAELLARPQHFYVVGIFGLPAKAITANIEELKSQATLRIKGQPPIQAGQVQTEQQPRGGVVIYLVFPRDQEGAHQITDADNEVEVILQLEAGKVSRKFKLKDMVFDGKLEL